MKKVHIIGGGTFVPVRPHFSLSAPAFGATAKELYGRFGTAHVMGGSYLQPELHLTKMADFNSTLVTNDDVEHLLGNLVADPDTAVIIMTAALCDWDCVGIREGGDSSVDIGTKFLRLRTGDFFDKYDSGLTLELSPATKLIAKIRKERKDIFLVGFKTTTGATEDEMFERGLSLMKSASCNLVFANDIHTRQHMIITPEEARYFAGRDRKEVLSELSEMVIARQKGTFTRSTVVDGPLVDWDDHRIPHSLRTVVNHCIKRGAYKPFEGKTVGHFAIKVDDSHFITSLRKSNFNELATTGMVRVDAQGDDLVVAHGAKPSVGGQSQRIIFAAHPETDCIVHFHCPLRTRGAVSTRSQKNHECGSHECGQNTSDGLESYGSIKAVMLDKHGPNIVFPKDIDPGIVIDFIETHWDLERSTRE